MISVTVKRMRLISLAIEILQALGFNIYAGAIRMRINDLSDIQIIEAYDKIMKFSRSM